MSKPQTHFEQVPLTVVKKIIDQQPKEEELARPIQASKKKIAKATFDE